MIRSLALLVDRKGSLWIGTFTHGLRRVIDPRAIRGRKIAQSGPEAEEFTVKDGLLSDIITAMPEHNEGNIWVATPRGLERFRESAFVAFPTQDSPRPKVVFTTRDSSVWVAAHNVFGFFRHRLCATDTIKTSFTPLTLFEDQSGGRWTVGDSGIHRERATSIGGRCDVRARPGSGTVVFVELPLAESAGH